MTTTSDVARIRPRLRKLSIVVVVLLIPAAAHGIWDQVEASLLARDIAAIHRRGEPTNVDFERTMLPTAEQRDAARLYAAAAALAEWRREGDRGTRLTARLEQAVAAHDLPAVQALDQQYARNEPALDLLARATPLDFRGFADIEPSLYANASPLLDLSDLNAIRADAKTIDGDLAGGADAIVQSVRLQRTFAVSFYRQAAMTRVLASVRLLLQHNPDESVLRRLHGAIEQLPERQDVTGELLLARARLIGDFWPYPSEQASWALRARMRTNGLGSQLGYIAFRPWITHQVRAMIRGFGPVIEASHQPFPQMLDASAALAREYSAGGPAMSMSRLQRTLGLFFGDPRLAPGMFAQSEAPTAAALEAERAVIDAAVAAERYRREHGNAAPSSLASLVPAYLRSVPIDPFSGEPLRYRLTSGAYIVYSVDLNRHDDGGALYGGYTGRPYLPSQLVGLAAYLGPGTYRPRDIGVRVELR